MNLQGILDRSSKWFDVSSVQIITLVTSLSGKFVQFSSGREGQDTDVHGDTGTCNTRGKLPHFYEVERQLNALYQGCQLLKMLVGARPISDDEYLGILSLIEVIRPWDDQSY